MAKKILLANHMREEQSLADRAYQAIRAAILRNELKPGTALSLRALSQELGVSRTPVREALKRLEEEGLVEMMARRGAFVTHISAEHILEIYQLREALECYTAQFVPQYGDPSELDQLVKEFEESHQWIEAGEIEKIDDADIRLHRYIAQAAQNRRLLKLVDQLLSQIVRLRAMTPTVPGRLAAQEREHLKIVHALKKGSVEEAREALREHLHNVRDTALQIRLRME